MMKKTPARVFTAVLISGLVGIIVIFFIRIFTENLIDDYEEYTLDYSESEKYIAEIRTGLYEHQAVVTKHILTTDESMMTEYKLESDSIISRINDNFMSLKAHIKSPEDEKGYHSAYSVYLSYLDNIDVALMLSTEGERESAVFYADNVMNPFIVSADEELTKMGQAAALGLESAKEKVDSGFKFIEMLTLVSAAAIFASSAIAIMYCVKITAGLENYKAELEEEIKEKNQALRSHTEKMMSIQNNTIIGMANLIESRDGDTGEHVKRTSFYVDILSRAAKDKGLFPETLTDSYIELLIKAAPLHDIGKIAVPDSILQKPGKLTKEEFERIKSHTTEGGRIIREVMGNIEEKEYVNIAEKVASCHHEKWDGSGYPYGMKGEDIPLEARIMAIADVFDALVSKRCYKEAMSIDEAFQIIKESEGSHFDPVLAKIFLSLRPQIEEYLNSSFEDNSFTL